MNRTAAEHHKLKQSCCSPLRQLHNPQLSLLYKPKTTSAESLRVADSAEAKAVSASLGPCREQTGQRLW